MRAICETTVSYPSGLSGLSGTIPNQQNGYGTLSFPFAGLQNGPDGLCLVTSTGVVMHLLAYEGAFACISGAAKGRTAEAISQSEASTAAVGTSLQLVGTGNHYHAFTWQASATASAGLRNTGQTFQ